ncbi:MAG: zinc-binding protein [Ruminococcaceae bacterium]|nr:zinc-binding protein [Oscillospiraceae bacterium]
MPDKNLVCKECKDEFIFTESDQSEFLARGHMNAPSRCAGCREARKELRATLPANHPNFQQNGRRERDMFPAVCASCNKSTTVPFRPRNDKPVFCRECYQGRRH